LPVRAEPRTIGPRDHVVHFYDHDDALLAPVAAYVEQALRDGGVAIVVATEEHRGALQAILIDEGVDLASAEASGRFLPVDAATALSSFIVDGRPDPALFDSAIGALVRRAAATGGPVRAYGEMVALLWDAGNVTAALELESLWNDLGKAVPFSLFCGYRVTGHGDDGAVDAVCALHSAVLDQPRSRRRIGAAEATRTFPAEIGGARAARRFVVDALERWGDSERFVEDAAIVVTELATNAVMHAESVFTVSVEDAGDRTRISVTDASGAVPVERDVTPWTGSGRGVRMVAAIAGSWGVDNFGQGKTVWAELLRRPA
jgi:anti-sigma regulatory factor (Ser/Thr protein kinase)